MKNWSMLRSGTQRTDDTGYDHEPQLPHESTRGLIVSITIAAAIGAVIVAGTLALFS